MLPFKTLTEANVEGKRVLLRADLNTPLGDGPDGVEVKDDFRIRASLATIATLRDRGAVVVIASHLGRPKQRDEAFSMAPVSKRLGELGGYPVHQLPDVVGPAVDAALAGGEPGDVFVLENTRFHPGEKANDPAFAAELAKGIDLFVLDAFGSAHRAHASVSGVAEYVESVAGPLLAAEVAALGRLMTDPARPFTVVLGGAKISDKLGVIKALLPKVDMMVIGGGMCFTLLAAQGFEIGSSLVEPELIDEARSILASVDGDRVLLPSDLVVASEFSETAVPSVVPRNAIGDEQMGLDIGPESAEAFARVVQGSASVFWNGPMGVFEWESFRAGTEAVGEALRNHSGYTVVGGGDSVAAVRLLGLENALSHVSTGGGAGLEMLEGAELPGLQALERWK